MRPKLHPLLRKSTYNTRLDTWFKIKLMDESKDHKARGTLSSPEIIVKAVCKMMKWKKPTAKELEEYNGCNKAPSVTRSV